MSRAIVDRDVEYANDWIEVVGKNVDLGPPRGLERFWSVRTRGDYTAVLAITEDGRIPLVRQFRPSVETRVLELPSGGVDPGETPEQAISRELLEETGCQAGELIPLGEFFVDSGRLETRQWGFFAPQARVVGPPSGGDEAGSLELLFVEPAEFRRLIADGSFRMCTHLSLVAVALLGGHIRL